MDLSKILLIAEIVIPSVIIPTFVFIILLINGVKCLLRSDMLNIYYHNKDTKKIRQYEYENFVYLYKAYKALKGNSFIDKIYKDIQTWEVVT